MNTLKRPKRGASNGYDHHSHPIEAAERCPWCNQPISRTEYNSIRARIAQQEHARVAQLEKRAEAKARAAIEMVRRDASAQLQKAKQEAAAAAVASFGAKLAKIEEQKKAADAKAKAAEAETKKLLDAQRMTLEKAADERVTFEREKRITENQRHQQELEALRRRVARERPQDLGEEGELNVLDLLSKTFPNDEISRVPRGKIGGDVVHKIVQGGTVVGKLLFEVKNRKLYQRKWTAKAREDQIAELADHVVVITAAFPKGQRELMVENGVLVTSPARLVAIVTWLRAQTIRSHALQLSSQERSSKAERLYSFMVSDRVADRWDRMAQTMARMRENLRAERAAHERAWCDRTDQIEVLTTIRDDFVEDLDGIFEGIERSS